MIDGTTDFEYPWYFAFHNITQAWDISQGEGVTVAVVDTCIDTHHVALENRAYYKNDTICVNKIEEDYTKLLDFKHNVEKRYDEKIQNKFAAEYVNYIHGTAMAGLIAASPQTLNKDTLSNQEANTVNAAGIAPKSKIVGIENLSVVDVFDQKFTEIKQETSDHKPLFKDHKRVGPILINLSGGQKEKAVEDHSFMDKASAWNDFLRRVCTKENLLIITAVGNDGIYLTKDTVQQGVLPAALKIPKACKNYDIILRVGATNYYTDESQISKYHRSNFGADYIDILAPGAGIPIITPHNQAIIGSGTSEATAIVTATIALMASCRPFARGISMKKSLLKNAGHYPHLETYASGGNVLNIDKSVKNFCSPHLADLLDKPTSATTKKDEL